MSNRQTHVTDRQPKAGAKSVTAICCERTTPVMIVAVLQRLPNGAYGHTLPEESLQPTCSGCRAVMELRRRNK